MNPATNEGTGDGGDQPEKPKWQPASVSEFRAFVSSLVNQRCWGAIVDNYNNGLGLIRLDFGEQYELIHPRSRYSPDLVQHRFTGESTIYQTYAPWRLDDLGTERVITTSFDSDGDLDRLKDALHGLIDRTITRIDIREPGLECTIQFDERFQLKLFPSIFDPDFSNYRICRVESVWTVYSVDAYSSLTVKTAPLV